jgi:ABC-type xylose transport system permease subunit
MNAIPTKVVGLFSFGVLVALTGIIVAACASADSPDMGSLRDRQVAAAALIPSGAAIALLAYTLLVQSRCVLVY